MNKESEDTDQIAADELEEQTVFKIEGVPLLKQPNKYWCGYTTLAMVLQYWHKQGHLPDLTKDELTPAAVFEAIHEEKPHMEREEFYPRPRPTLDTLAIAAEKITKGQLEAKVIKKKQYDELEKRGISPMTLLNAFLLRKDAPCIVRIPGHLRVAVGMDIQKNTYFFNDSWNVRTIEEDRDYFLKAWQKEESNPEDYPAEAVYAMLVLQPRRKTPRIRKE